MSDKLSFKLEVFEGPLDLLLSLIAKNKINIYDIPVSLLLEQYMQKLDEMKQMDIEVASEFLTMAAHLIYIKSQMLLPRHEEEEEEDPRERLVRMLVEYQRYKEIVLVLAVRAQAGDNRFVKKPDEVEPDDTYRRNHTVKELYEAYLAVQKRVKRRMPPPVTSFRGIVGRTVVSVNSKVVEVLRRLLRQRTIQYRAVFEHSKSRSDIVATFLAVLELTKLRRIRFIESQAGEYTLHIAENGEV